MASSAAVPSRRLGIEVQIVPTRDGTRSNLCVSMLTFELGEHVSEVSSGELVEAELKEAQPLPGESDLGFAMRVTRKALRAMEDRYYAAIHENGGLAKAYEWLEA